MILLSADAILGIVLRSHQIWHRKEVLCIADVQHARWTPTDESNVELL